MTRINCMYKTRTKIFSISNMENSKESVSIGFYQVMMAIWCQAVLFEREM